MWLCKSYYAIHCDYDYRYDYNCFTFDPSMLPIISVTHFLDSVLEPVTKMADNDLHSVLELRPPSWEHDAHAHAQRSSEWDTTRESLRAFANELPARKPLKHVRPEIVMIPSLASSSKSYQQSVERQDRDSPLARQRQHLARNALALDKPMQPRRRQSAGHDSEPFPTGGPYFAYFPATLAKEKTMQEGDIVDDGGPFLYKPHAAIPHVTRSD